MIVVYRRRQRRGVVVLRAGRVDPVVGVSVIVSNGVVAAAVIGAGVVAVDVVVGAVFGAAVVCAGVLALLSPPWTAPSLALLLWLPPSLSLG